MFFLEAGTWSDAIICGCEQFPVAEVDNGDNFSHLLFQTVGLTDAKVREKQMSCDRTKRRGRPKS